MKPVNPTIKQAIRDVYAWPGAYPMHLVMDDGECLCMACARAEWRQVCHSTMHKISDGWRAIAVEINWENAGLCCAHCGDPIESAYGGEE